MPKYIQIKARRHQRACRHQTSLHLILSHSGLLSNFLLSVPLSSPRFPLPFLSFPHFLISLYILHAFISPHFSSPTPLILSFALFPISRPPDFPLSGRKCVGRGVWGSTLPSLSPPFHILPNGFKYCHTSQSLGIQVILYFIHSREPKSHNTHYFFYFPLSFISCSPPL